LKELDLSDTQTATTTRNVFSFSVFILLGMRGFRCGSDEMENCRRTDYYTMNKESKKKPFAQKIHEKLRKNIGHEYLPTKSSQSIIFFQNCGKQTIMQRYFKVSKTANKRLNRLWSARLPTKRKSQRKSQCTLSRHSFGNFSVDNSVQVLQKT